MMPKYYIEFKTWAEGRIETPWPFVWFNEIDDYRKRDNLTKQVSSDTVRRAFISFDETICRRFLQEHVTAIALGAVIEAPDSNAAVDEAMIIFGYIEVIGIAEVTDSNKAQVDLVMANAGVSPGAAI